MTEILQANIFFIISSVGVVALTILACVLVYHLIKIVQSVRRIVERVELGSEVLADDIENLRENLNPAKLITYIMGFIPNMATKKRRKTRTNED